MTTDVRDPAGPDPAAPLHTAHDQLRAFGLGLPEAWEDFPWGHTALKVRKKAFAFLARGTEGDTEDGGATEEGGATEDGGATAGPAVLSLTCKLPHSAADALERADAEPSGYGLGRHGWVTFRFVEGQPLPEQDQLEAWIVESYRAVAPKTLSRSLDADR
jgi:predicted DNA-binding protein (MmcQ/YjbR family)